MIAALIAALVSLGPAAQGALDARVSSFAFFLGALGFSAWIFRRVAAGSLPLPGPLESSWAAALAGLSGLSAGLSLIPVFSAVAWRSMVLGLWIVPAVSLASESERGTIENAVLLGAWALVFLAVAQKILVGGAPDAGLINSNVFAGMIAMLLPLSIQKKNYPLAAMLVVCLLWTRSLGAFLSLAAAAFIFWRPASKKMIGVLACAALVCGLILLKKVDTPGFLNRWSWWKAAARMSFSRPWLGLGPGIFAYLLPLKLKAHLLRSRYAHQYYLQTAAECGWPYLLIFLSGIYSFFPRSFYKRWAVGAALIHGLGDYALNVPAGFWIFCYLMSSEMPMSSRRRGQGRRPSVPGALGNGVGPQGRGQGRRPSVPEALGNGVGPRRLEIKPRLKPVAWALAAGLAAVACRPAWSRWRSECFKTRALQAAQRGEAPEKIVENAKRSLSWAEDPEAERLYAEAEIKLIGEGKVPAAAGTIEAIRRLEMAAKDNPYRAANWEDLAELYRRAGRLDRAAWAQGREKLYFSP